MRNEVIDINGMLTSIFFPIALKFLCQLLSLNFRKITRARRDLSLLCCSGSPMMSNINCVVNDFCDEILRRD